MLSDGYHNGVDPFCSDGKDGNKDENKNDGKDDGRRQWYQNTLLPRCVGWGVSISVFLGQWQKQWHSAMDEGETDGKDYGRR